MAKTLFANFQRSCYYTNNSPFGSLRAAKVDIDMSTAILLKIQDAIDAVPSNNKQVHFILVKPGTYREKIVVPADKPFITLSGTKPFDTIITWSEGGEIFNKFGTSGKAVAVRVSGDKAAFYGCRFLSYQDTLLDDAGKHYFNNCYIEGATDFICGNAASLYERCHLHSLSKGNGSITAQKRISPSEKHWFYFLGLQGNRHWCCFLGRPWGAYLDTVYYGEYKCYGPGADTSKRVQWSHRLSPDEAAPFLTKDMIGGRGWLRPTPKNFKRPSKL
ncbi:hypothetical protein V6Z11_1Z137900 [Gossypium hirsutum]